MKDLFQFLDRGILDIYFDTKDYYYTYSEYIKNDILFKRKYRRCWKDLLLRFPFFNYISYLRSKKNYYNHLNVDYIKSFREHLFENKRDYLELYNLLEDSISKNILVDLLYARFTGNFRKAMSESVQYFEENIIHFTENEVFVDCGAFIGDTTNNFIDSNPYVGTSYVIEPGDSCLLSAKENLKNKKVNLHFIQKGVAEQKEILPYDCNGGLGASFVNVKSSANENVKNTEVDTIDNIVQEPATFIKMDIEGFEINALLGAKSQISKYHPRLAICIYHKPDDFITIPKLIRELDMENKYKYYIRHYSPGQYETVLYAIPNN